MDFLLAIIFASARYRPINKICAISIGNAVPLMNGLDAFSIRPDLGASSDPNCPDGPPPRDPPPV